MKRLAVIMTLVAGTLACDEENPCDRYADYVCTCHDGEDGFDCDALRDLAVEPTQSVSDACTIDLQEQKSEDQTAGLTCDTTV